ncbi:MAG: hypothetical protein ABW170_08165 [Candidatus Thiodiazotropha sp. L084R]
MKQERVMINTVIIAAITGCTSLTPPMERPIIEDHSHDGRVTTFATIPSRRMVVLTEHMKNSGKLILCAEPSADVSDNIASSLAAAMTVKGPASDEKSTAELAASISKTLATTAQHLFKRTQGLQLYRDGMYNLCQARMNGIINDSTFMNRADTLLKKSSYLIEKELPYLHKSQPPK